MTCAVALEVGVGVNDGEVKVELVLNKEEESGLRDGAGSEVGSSAGRLGVGSTVGGRGRSVAPSVVVVVKSGGEGVSVGLD